jgi:hypothetical protein
MPSALAQFIGIENEPAALPSQGCIKPKLSP